MRCVERRTSLRFASSADHNADMAGVFDREDMRDEHRTIFALVAAALIFAGCYGLRRSAMLGPTAMGARFTGSSGDTDGRTAAAWVRVGRGRGRAGVRQRLHRRARPVVLRRRLRARLLPVLRPGKDCGDDDGCGELCVVPCPNNCPCSAATFTCETSFCCGRTCGEDDGYGGKCLGPCPDAGKTCNPQTLACE